MSASGREAHIERNRYFDQSVLDQRNIFAGYIAGSEEDESYDEWLAQKEKEDLMELVKECSAQQKEQGRL